MSGQRGGEAFLKQHTGLFICAACLARELGLTAPQGRDLMWGLHSLPDYEMRGVKCSHCSYGKRCIRYVGRVAIHEKPEGATAQLLTFLRNNSHIYLCDACLVFSVGLGIRDVNDIVESVARTSDELDRREAKCTVCARTTLVTAASSS